MASFPSIHAGQGGRGKGSQVLAAVTRSPGEMVVEDVSGPGRARAGHVIVRPERVGICGSDFHLFSGDVGALSGARDFYPRIQGHEVSAIVDDPGDSGRARGERVAIWPLLPCGRCYPCRIGRPNVCPAFRLVGVHLDGGLAERLEVPAGLVFGAGDLDPDSACFVEPASVAVHALARGRLRAGEQVVVFGAGPIGLATLVAAVAWGSQPELTELSREWTGGEGPPLIVETSGEPGVLAQAVELAPSAGRIVVIGMSSGTAPVRPGAFPEKELDVIGSSCATAADFGEAIRLVAACRAALAQVFSHHFPLARAAEAFEFAMSRPPDAIKIVVTVN
jgi:threonine dehydrogenase-like Zn-dependent dehydrogenase